MGGEIAGEEFYCWVVGDGMVVGDWGGWRWRRVLFGDRVNGEDEAKDFKVE